jgi:sugar transferase (PEP-CTERM/EpsH1 system associated)
MERGLVNVVNLSDPAEFRHVILCLGEAGPLASRVTAANCRIVELRKRSGNDVSLPLKLAAWAKRLRLDVLHARGWPALVETAIAASLGGVRSTVYGFHGKTMDELGAKSLRRRLAEMLVPRLYSEVVTLTETMKADVARECRLDANRVRVIPNGVDTDVFRPTGRRSELRAEFGLPVDGLILGCVARLDRVKNHAVIVRALSRLRSTGVDALLLLVGEGPERARLEGHVRDARLAPQVRWFGHSDRVPDVMNCMDIYVQPSLYEGFSNTVLEAMACGLPVLATRTGGTVDVLRDGEQGYLFEPEDDRTLASLVRALNEPDGRRAMGLRARRRATESFPQASMVQGYERLYRDLGSRRRAERAPGPSVIGRRTV